jgi:hypothetical protein
MCMHTNWHFRPVKIWHSARPFKSCASSDSGKVMHLSPCHKMAAQHVQACISSVFSVCAVWQAFCTWHLRSQEIPGAANKQCTGRADKTQSPSHLVTVWAVSRKSAGKPSPKPTARHARQTWATNQRQTSGRQSSVRSGYRQAETATRLCNLTTRSLRTVKSRASRVWWTG